MRPFCPDPPLLDTAGILLPSPICLSASNRKQMKNDIKFYNQPGADREDWYRTHFRKLLATMAPGESYPYSEPE